MKIHLPLAFAIAFSVLFLSTPNAHAQLTSLGAATYIEIAGEAMEPGSIVKFSESGYKLTTTAYDPTIFGVVVKEPALALEASPAPGTYPVVSSGKVLVRVTNANGNIAKGDLLTSSEIPGIAQKVTQSGYVLGTALEDYTAGNPNQIGTVLVQLNLNFTNAPTTAGNNLLSTLRVALSAPYLAPLNALRYVLAIGIILLSFFLGVNHFGRIARTGIEAVGRNPLAQKIITLTVIINVVIGIGVIFVGLVIAYFILVI